MEEDGRGDKVNDRTNDSSASTSALATGSTKLVTKKVANNSVIIVLQECYKGVTHLLHHARRHY
jgi:hypothetical protein